MKNVIFRLAVLLAFLFAICAAIVLVICLYQYNYDFSPYPKITHTKSRAAGDPINVFFVSSKDQITRCFLRAGWLIPDPITLRTSAKIAIDSLANRSYPTAPVSNLYVFGRVQDLAFEKPTNDVQYRGHIRLWRTGMFINGQPVWVGAASYDSGIELSRINHLPTHHIAPTVDLERNAVGSDLEKAGCVKTETDTTFVPPLIYARNGGGDYYESDGDVLVINYTQTAIPLSQPVWGVEGLKDGTFLFYDTLLSIPGVLIAFLVLVVALCIGLVLWWLTKISRALV